MAESVLSRTLGYADLALRARTLRRSTDHEVAARARDLLVERMGKLRGLPQKMGQMLSMGGDDSRAADFDRLTDRAEPLPFEEIEPILREAWSSEVSDVVQSIDTHGIAASLGQVHRATLKDGRDVAVKVQYPGIRKAAMRDLKMLGWLSAPVGDLRRGFDMHGYRAEVLRDLEEELDYRIEAAHQIRFAEAARGTPGWIVPEVIDSLSTDRVLVTTWIDGERIAAAAERSLEQRQSLATTIINGLFANLFSTGFIHADPHAGNYRFEFSRMSPRVVLLDYGSMFELPIQNRLLILKLIQMTMTGCGDPFKPLIALGFNRDLLEPIREKLAAVCGTIFEPFTNPGRFDVRQWNRRERIADILGDDKWNFRMSGPPWLLFVMRVFHGLTYYLDKLDAPVSWSIAIRRHLNANASALDAIDATPEPEVAGAFEHQARHLRIRVTERGREKVLLRFPARSVDNLHELMDDDLQARIREQGYNIDSIVKTVRRSAYQPQTLIRLSDAATEKAINVWLE